ncbi:right-handed parallel beta-helix repeat-containing protein [Curtobacterium sp. MCLR17_043]|uniref:right-handed parallel beta-helix repeat-containing protein n=1 Tax=Curtobacterium sp. MCLR17_043 TaxID=2175627 RepID=UPI0011B7A89C|nr:right-handed parallel beta-helix repeat-containing protein [Curtobacterium sp. MCLR17_043]
MERARLDRRSALVAGLMTAALGAAALGVALRPGAAEGEEPRTDPLQDALDATGDGRTLVIDRVWTRTRPLLVRRRLTLRFAAGGALRMTADDHGIVVTASGVRVVAPVIEGIGASKRGSGHGIVVRGTREAPLDDVRISGGRLERLPSDGVHVEYCDRFVLERAAVSSVGYAGVLLLGVVDSVVQDTVVSDVRQPAGLVNSYGITVTRDATATVDVARRSSRVRILRNRISDVPHWEGIDTHAGDAIEIRDNIVTGCRVGIAAVPSKAVGDRSATDVAPTRLLITGNRVTRNAALAAGSGILVSGSGMTVGSSLPRATGSVSGNTVTGAGGTGSAGVLVKLTRGFVVADNTVASSVDDAIRVEHSNSAVTVRDNRITKVTGDSVAIDVRSGGNDGTVVRNRIDAPARSVRVGLRFGTRDNRFLVRGNDFSAAVTREFAHGASIRR